uniref:Muscarinic toxin BM14 n=1 Tax=Bungarus multicinctus TaxID=8616 RepID=3NOHE_BUNMU|nr:RecName: Full=Muscarinic toxin BM14; Flags: Precursor [Bungarus multicinctus]CAD18848.1 muscarinic toxin-like protein [Bungarus multicinctus]
MKTLLLTLVVVTIICLDLGYTEMCNMCVRPYPFMSSCCPEGQDRCYKSYWVNENGKQKKYHGKYPVILERGCVTACTGPGSGSIYNLYTCCPTNRCGSSSTSG